MKQPKELKIGFRKYKLLPSSEPHPQKTYFGICKFEEGEIEIREDLGKDEKATTLFHEYCHAALDESSLTSFFTTKQEELLCTFFGNKVMELVRRNWEVLEWAKVQGKV